MTFARAVEAGREQIGPAGRPFAFAIDVAMLQDVLKVPPHAPDAHARDNSFAFVSVLQYRPPPPVTAEDLAAAEDRLAGLLTDVVPPPGPLPVGSRMPLAANPLFVGREQDLRVLARWLKGTDQVVAGPMQIAAVTGLGGVGKTQLATELVHRYGPFFTGGVFWLSFADSAAVPMEVAGCGLAGGLGLRPDFAGLDLQERLALVVGAWQSRIPRLLVFDNCEDAALLDAWRPKSGGCRVVVTSRRATWAATLGIQVLAMGVLPRAESVTLLRQYRQDLSADDTNLEAIAVELGNLPLALHLAGSVLALYRDEITPANYLAQVSGAARFEALEVEEEESGGPSPTHHVQSLWRTFALSYERLDPMKEGDALAQALLVRAACLAPGEPIPRRFLRTTLAHATHTPQGLREIGRSVRRLVDLGLLEETAEDTLRMHRLVVAFVRQRMPDDDAQAAVEQALLESAMGSNGEIAHSSLRALEVHLSFVTDAAAKRADERAARLCALRGAQLRSFGDYRRAEAYLKQALAIRKQVLGKPNSEIVASLYDVGFVLKDQGKFAEAQDYFEQALAIIRHLRGEEHLETAVSFNNLGLVYKDLRRFREAQGYFERALQITDARDPDHPNSVDCLHNLAWLSVDQGDERLRARARSYLDRALKIQQRVFGEQDLRTVESLNGLGELLFRQGDFGDTVPDEPYKEAQSYFNQALAIRAKLLGERHPETAESLNNLGRVLERQGDTAAARSYFERALKIQREVLAEGHPRTAQTLANLGRLLGRTSADLWEAKLNLEQARDIFERTVGPEHPDTIEVRSDLSRIEAQLEYWSSYYRGSVGG
jgi:tetratricopeptide (TPR) repeat protein